MTQTPKNTIFQGQTVWLLKYVCFKRTVAEICNKPACHMIHGITEVYWLNFSRTVSSIFHLY